MKYFKIFSKLVNLLSINGNKIRSRKLLLNCFLKIKSKGYNPLDVFKKAIKSVFPVAGLSKQQSRNKSLYKLKYLSYDQKISLSLKWLIEGAYLKKHSFCDNLADELIEASIFKGYAYNKKLSIINKFLICVFNNF